MMALEMIGGLIYLLLGGDLLVRGATALARKAAIPPVVVGLTVVAFGTSAPELFVSLQAVFEGFPGMSIGNVVGSNVANVLLVLGLPALMTATRCDQRHMGLHVSLMLGASVRDGLVLLVLLCVFLGISWMQGTIGDEAEAELERVLGLPSTTARIALFVLLGIVCLPVGAELMVDAGARIAEAFGVSDAVIGLTLFALGTSLPELGTTLVAAMLRQADVAIGNIVGSNLFNLLAIMGVTSIAAPGPLPVAPSFLAFDLWVMLASALLLAGFTWTGIRVGRAWGSVLLVAYATYVVLLLRG
jgi:cation:H+ antiporter